MIAGSSAEMAEADAAATRVKAKKSPFAGFKNILKKK
jgi:hypothetical protein